MKEEIKESVAFILPENSKVLAENNAFPRIEMIEEEDFQRALHRAVFEKTNVRVQDYNFICSLYEGKDRVHYFLVKGFLGDIKTEGLEWTDLSSLNSESDKAALNKLK